MTGSNEDWYSPEVSTFGDRLTGAREAAGLDQNGLSEAIGVKKSTVAAWENDMKEPRANRLQMLAGVLGVSLSWLLTGEGEGPDGPVGSGLDDTEIAALLQEMRQLRREMAGALDKMGRVEQQIQAAMRRV